MKTGLFAVIVIGSLLIVGCATSHQEHQSQGGMMAGMSKSHCKMMVADVASPSKCKMCGGNSADHDHGVTSPGTADHSAHQH